MTNQLTRSPEIKNTSRTFDNQEFRFQIFCQESTNLKENLENNQIPSKFNPIFKKKNTKFKKKTKVKKKVYPKHNWTIEEDEKLRDLVKKQAEPFNWSEIARYFEHRVGKQCRERWHNHLSESISKSEWTLEEDMKLVRLHALHGNKWAFLSQYFPGRTDNMIKNRWNTTLSKNSAAFCRMLDACERKSKKKGLGKQEEQGLESRNFDRLSFGSTHFDSIGLKSGSSLNDLKVEIVPIATIGEDGKNEKLEVQSPMKNDPQRFNLSLSSPTFSLRIPVFSRNIAVCPVFCGKQ